MRAKPSACGNRRLRLFLQEVALSLIEKPSQGRVTTKEILRVRLSQLKSAEAP
jgi:hypothetical protein